MRVPSRRARRGPVRRCEPPAGERGEAARGRPRERELRVLERVQRRVLDQHVRPEEGDEPRNRDLEPLPLALEEVAELVDQDHRDEADAELPAPDERVGGDRDEETEELEREEAELDREAHGRRERSPQLAEQAPPARLGVDRLVVAEIRLELWPGRELAHRLIVATAERRAG